MASGSSGTGPSPPGGSHCAEGSCIECEDSGIIICEYCGKELSSLHHKRQHVEAIHAEHSRTAVTAPQGNAQPNARWDDQFLGVMSEVRVMQHVPRDVVTTIKKQVAAQVASLHEQVLERITPRMGAGVNPEALIADIFHVCRDFMQRDSELDRLRKSEAYVQPKKRWLGTHPESGEEFYAYDNPLDKALEAMWKTQPHTLDDVRALSKRIMIAALSGYVGEDSLEPSFDRGLKIEDTLDGFGTWKYIMQFPFKKNELPLFFIFYYDGLEVVNGLGQARLTHELGCFYWALIPLDQIYRLNSIHLRLATVCLKRATSIPTIGMHTVIHGRPEDRNDPNCHAWGRWMARLKSGHSFTTPEGEFIGRGGTVLLAADTPAASECIGTKKSVGPSTKSICRNCHCPQWGSTNGGSTNSPHRSPNSFLAGMLGWKEHTKDRRKNFPLRSEKDLREYLSKGEAVLNGEMTLQALSDWLATMGVNSFAGSLAGTPCPMDIMHIVFEGIARQMLGALSYHGISKWGWNPFHIAKWIALMARDPSVDCARHELPYVNSSRATHLGIGQGGGLPSSDCSFPGTAMQIAKLILNVNICFAEILTPEQKRDPVWQVTANSYRIAIR